ncbi:hypothetical protein B0H13DRAFT_2300913 [Mycena leptocephala]|nr:hypothetical protein B0H13DRAFT_2300913 [Mycena leptocephala]
MPLDIQSDTGNNDRDFHSPQDAFYAARREIRMQGGIDDEMPGAGRVPMSGGHGGGQDRRAELGFGAAPRTPSNNHGRSLSFDSASKPQYLRDQRTMSANFPVIPEGRVPSFDTGELHSGSYTSRDHGQRSRAPFGDDQLSTAFRNLRLEKQHSESLARENAELKAQLARHAALNQEPGSAPTTSEPSERGGAATRGKTSRRTTKRRTNNLPQLDELKGDEFDDLDSDPEPQPTGAPVLLSADAGTTPVLLSADANDAFFFTDHSSGLSSASSEFDSSSSSTGFSTPACDWFDSDASL